MNRVSKIVETFETFANPFSLEDEGTLRNIYTNTVVPSRYVEDIINIDECGKESLKNSGSERFSNNAKKVLWDKGGKNKFANFTSALLSKTVTKGKRIDMYHSERDLFAKFIIISRSSREIDEKYAISNFELANYPPSLFVRPALIPCLDKSKLANEIVKTALESHNVVNTKKVPPFSCLIIDGMVVVQSLQKEHWVKNCSDLATLFISKIDHLVSLKMYTEVIVVFDSYKPNSLKQMTREHRHEGEDTVHYVVNDASNIVQVTLKKFLKNETTTKESHKLVNHAKIKYSCKFVAVADNIVFQSDAAHDLQSRFNHDEADTLLIFYAIDVIVILHQVKLQCIHQILMCSSFYCIFTTYSVKM